MNTNPMLESDKPFATYYNIIEGKIRRSFGKTQPEDFETTARVNKNGETVYEQISPSIKGVMTKVEIQSHEQYGDSIRLTLQLDDYTAILSIHFDSAYGRSFLFKAPNIYIETEVKIMPYSFTTKEGKKMTGVNVYQEGEKVPNAYSKDVPNGLPQLVKVTFNGKDQWDKTEQLAFLMVKFNEFAASIAGKSASGNVEPASIHVEPTSKNVEPNPNPAEAFDEPDDESEVIDPADLDF